MNLISSFTLLIIIASCASSLKKPSLCELKPYKLDPAKIRTLLKAANNTWEYQYSIHADSCLVLEDLKTLPQTMRFQEGDTVALRSLVPTTYPRHYAPYKNDALYGLECYIDEKSKPTYPLMNRVYKDSTTIKLLYIDILSTGYDQNHYIKRLDKDTLILKNEVMYTVYSKRLLRVHHVYTNKK